MAARVEMMRREPLRPRAPDVEDALPPCADVLRDGRSPLNVLTVRRIRRAEINPRNRVDPVCWWGGCILWPHPAYHGVDHKEQHDQHKDLWRRPIPEKQQCEPDDGVRNKNVSRIDEVVEEAERGKHSETADIHTHKWRASGAGPKYLESEAQTEEK